MRSFATTTSRGLPAALFAACLGGPLSAQTVYALESNGAGVETVHRVALNCTALQSFPVPAWALPAPVQFTFGGIAWTGQNLLVSDGGVLTTLDAQGNQLQSCPIVGFGVLHDIACDGASNTLHFTDGGSLGSVPIGCPMGGLPPQRRATVPAPLQVPVTALDTDPVTGNLWVCDAAGTIAEVAFVGQWSAQVVQSFPLAQLPGQQPAQLPVGGMVFDRCSNRILLADASGLLVQMDLQGNATGQCQLPTVNGNLIAGLAKRARVPMALPGACAGNGMPACTPVCFTTGGDATVPNPNLRVEVKHAPYQPGAVAHAFVALDIAQGQLQIPGLCGPLMLAGTPAMTLHYRGPLFYDWTATAPCQGWQAFDLPIPNQPTLCGFAVFAQWAFLAPTGAISLSDALMIAID
ncbi:MAG: hypothetical protein KAI24_06280 [Planctomycetes bacterium]|nr:hypothetical protein [Planctomycetota bacterium]